MPPYWAQAPEAISLRSGVRVNRRANGGWWDQPVCALPEPNLIRFSNRSLL